MSGNCQTKMCSIKTNDILDELLSENNRILNELMFAKDLVECLQRLRKCLIDFNSKCNCADNCDNKTYFLLLDHKYKQVMKNRETNQSSNDCKSLYRCLCNIQIKQEPEDPIRLPDERRSKRAAEEGVKRQTKQKKRKSVTFNESNNVINEFAVESEVEETENQLFSDIFEEQFLTIKCDKLSTNLSKDEIIRKVANDECIARIDSENKFVKIFCSSVYSITTGPSDDSIFGFGCRLCNYISNHKNHIKHHILKTHNKENQINTKSEIEWNGYSISIRKTEQNNEQQSEESIESLIQRVQNQIPNTNDKCGTPKASSLEKSGATESSANLSNDESEDEFSTSLGDDITEVESDSDFELQEIDDSDDFDWDSKAIKKKKKTKKTKNKIVKKSNEIGSQVKANKSKVIMLVSEIQDKMSKNECRIETSANNQLIKLIFLSDESSKSPIGYICGWIGCEKVFAARKSLAKHIHNVHEKTNRFLEKGYPFNKKSCNTSALREMIDQNKIDVHDFDEDERIKLLYSKPESEEQPNVRIVGFGCKLDDCSYVSPDKRMVKQHLMTKHDIAFEEIYRCDGCPFKAVVQTLLTKHLKRCPGSNSRELTNGTKQGYVCEWEGCEFRCFTTRTMTNHVNHHKNIKPFTCDWPSCDCCFFTQHGLNKHVKSVHEDVRPYPCTWPGCEQKCRTPSKLKAHMICHGDERPFACSWPQCDKRFRSDSTYRQHRIIHTQDKRFVCEWPGCQSRFRDAYGLKFHYMVHKGENPIACPADGCGTRFKVKSGMLKHFRRRHPGQLKLIENLE